MVAVREGVRHIGRTRPQPIPVAEEPPEEQFVEIASEPVTHNRHQQQVMLRIREEAGRLANRMFGDMLVAGIENKFFRNDPALFNFLKQLEDDPPVDIETFLDSKEFIGATDIILWPEVRKAIIDINKDWWRGPKESYTEALLSGATSTGKSEAAKIITLYHVYLLGCLKNPQAVYGLPRTTSIVFPIMAAKPHVTKRVIYAPIRKMIEAMPWFQKNMRLDPLIDSEIYFTEKNVRIVMGGADSDSILGEAIIGGILDEVNFMNVVLKSKRAEVSTGRSGIYDQASTIYESVSRRKKSRFITPGPQIGIICVASSTRYSGDFTDKRKKQIKELNEKHVYVYDKKQYEVWPADRYCGETFRLLVGNDILTDTRVLRDDEQVQEGSLVLDVPVEYKADFLREPHDTLRDVIGMSTSSYSPFFRRRFKILEAIRMGEDAGLNSFLIKDNVTLGVEGLPIVKLGHFCVNPSRPRYVHIDLSLNSDRCGIAMVRFDGLQEVERTSDGKTSVEQLPVASIEMAVSIQPDSNNEISIAEIRAWVKQLKEIHGYPIRVVTYDGWSCISGDSRIWTNKGLIRADQVKAGDIVQSRSGANPVEKVFNYGKTETLTVETDSGHALSMTAAHKIQVLKQRKWRVGQPRQPVWEWVRADQLRKDHVVRIWEGATEVDVSKYQPLKSTPAYSGYTKYFYNQPLVMNEDIARALGMIWGDGSFHYGGFSIAAAIDEGSDVVNLITKAFEIDCKIKIRHLPSQKSVVVDIWCQHLRDWFRVNSLDDKTDIPDVIKRSPLSVQAAFISGLFATDGTVKKRDGQVSIEQSRKPYIDYIADVLTMGFGMRVCITSRTRTYTLPQDKYGEAVERTGTFHILSVTGSRREFYEKIGFAYAVKQDRLMEHIDVPGRFIYAKVKKITDSVSDVFDFQIANDHSYLANGFVSHNSLDARQQWKKEGMRTGLVSVDKTSIPYKHFRDAINDGRIHMYQQDVLVGELFDLEYDEVKDKIDHPPKGSKDCADACVGAYFTMLQRRSSWIAAAQDDEAHLESKRAEFAERFEGGRA